MLGLFKKKTEKINQKWAFGALAAYIVMLVVNGLGGSTTLLGGLNTAAVSDSFPNLFAPAGYTFSIWGLIYLLLGLFFFRAFEIWRTKKPEFDSGVINRVLVLFTLSSLLNTLWMFAWQYKVMWLSVVLMAGLLVTLIRINRELLPRKDSNVSWQESALTRLPFSVYFGWITVATIANITTFFASNGWNGEPYSQGTWMVGILLVGALIGIVTALRNRDPAYLAVFAWAYTGILVKHLSPAGHNGAYPSTIVALTVLLPIFILITMQLTSRLKIVRELNTKLSK